MGNFFQNGRATVLGARTRDPQTAPHTQGIAESSAGSKPTREHSALSRILYRPAIAALFFGVVSTALFLAGIERPAILFYDEGLFVPEARLLLPEAPEPSSLIRMHSMAKPPLGKMIMAMGMAAAGDNPFGWRVAAALCGAGTLVAVYLWALLLLGDARLAFFAAVLTLFNNFLFVMSRVGMMDAFMMVFLMWSLVAFTAALILDLRIGRRRSLFICSGVLMGLAGACKWNAIDSLAVLFLVSFALLWVARRLAADSIPALSRAAQNTQEIGVLMLLLGLVVAPILSYCLTYWPLCRILQRPFSVSELIAMHRFSWYICTTWVSNAFITSAWYTWPLKTSPQRALSYLVGNPVVTWGGLVALLFCLWRFFKTAALPEGLVLLLFAANFFQWAVTPEKGLFYYYYYPAVMILGVAIALALRSLPPSVFGVRISLVVLVAAAAIFLWCYPRMAHLDAPWDCALGCWS